MQNFLQWADSNRFIVFVFGLAIITFVGGAIYEFFYTIRTFATRKQPVTNIYHNHYHNNDNEDNDCDADEDFENEDEN